MSEITNQVWGNGPGGEEVHLYTLRNTAGTEVAITNYGGRVVSIRVPDRKGEFADVALGFEDLAGYLGKNPYFGALVGRYANRIADAQFTLDGKIYKLAANNGLASLHGGIKGFDKVVWKAVEDGGNLRLDYLSVDGEDGYPGNLRVQATYSLSEDNALRIDYLATTDKNTVLNLTNHSYFDLAGAGQGKVVGHVVTINADRFTPVDQHLIPTGELRPVEGSPFDFREATPVGQRIDSANEQLKLGLGYDHNFVLNRSGQELTFAARAMEPVSGRVLEVWTTEPGMQFYTGNHLDGTVKGKGEATYGFRTGFCFETQHFPNSPNQPSFPTTELTPGEEFRSSTVFRFSVKP